MAGAGIIPVENETEARSFRKTRDGRTITYKLKVLQHPERARACGSGAKSSTDRRPVDPPPIVELKIYEGEGNDNELKDITFSHEATFFLFIGLEQARVIAHGRTQQEHKQPAALKCAGQPVSGCTYLDRPNPAGYFLFPDISVRHEGQYRLNFNLFEKINEPQDDDLEAPNSGPVGENATHRLEVRSVPFTVYSAKKFPGLAESTELSRVIAEQGCRVRIRRDVRMRKRSDKPTKDWEQYEDDTAEARRRLSATPEAAGYNTQAYMESSVRTPSTSNSRHASLVSQSRRPSLQDVNTAVQPPYGVTPQLPYPHSYVNAPATHPAFAQQPAYPMSMQPPPPSYQSGHTQPVVPPPAPAPPQSAYAYGPPPPIPTAQPQDAPPTTTFDAAVYPHRPSIDYTSPTTHRRPSSIYAPVVQSPQTYSNYQQTSVYPPSYQTPHTHHSSFSSIDGYSRPAPAEPIQPPTRATGVLTPLPSRPFEDKKLPLPLLNTGNSSYSTSNIKHLEPSSPVSAPIHQQQQPSSYYPAPLSAPTALDTHKRSYSQVFNERHLAEPLRQGARPTPSMYTGSSASAFGMYTQVDVDPSADADGDVNEAPVKMIYRRADGRQVNRNLPPHD